MSHLLYNILEPMGATGALIAALILLLGFMIMLWEAFQPIFILLLGSPERKERELMALRQAGRKRSNFITSWIVLLGIVYLMISQGMKQ